MHIGPVSITPAVVTTWVLMLLLTTGAWLATRRLSLSPGTLQTVLELVVDAIDSQIRDTIQTEPGPHRAFIGTIFLFVLLANWSSLIPGVKPPTAHLEIDAALALLVFFAVMLNGIRAGGVRGYLASFAVPYLLMVPLNFVGTFARTFSMMVRLFGNVMSGVFVIGIALSLAGLLVPIPLMALELLTGAVQAYIFAVLAMVFIANTIHESTPERDSTADAAAASTLSQSTLNTNPRTPS
jgi:F-type H+-transporting ATPase subunit a